MESVANQVTRDLITEQIRRLIIRGDLKDGDEVTQNELAQALGVSRMPVREAMQELVQQGLLEKLPNRHVCVNGMTRARLEMLISALASLEARFLKLSLVEDAEGEVEAHRAFFERLDNPMLASSLQLLFDGCIAILIEQYPSAERSGLLKSAFATKDASKLDDYFTRLKEDILEDADGNS